MNKQQDMGYGDDVQGAESAEPAAAEQPRETAQVKDEPRVVRQKLAPIALTDSGILAPRDSHEDARIADMMLSTRVLPTCFQTREQVILAVQMLRHLGIPPALGMRQVMVVNNILAIWGELPKGACQKHIESFDEFRFTKDYTPIKFANKNLHEEAFGSITIIKRRDVDKPEESFFTRQQAADAGLLNKKGPWMQYTDRMLQMRARSRGLKDLFPDILSGVTMAEYDLNILDGRGTPTYGESSVVAASLADEINALPEAS